MSDTSFVAGQNNQPKLILTAPDGAKAEIYQFGSHVTSWVPTGGVEQLFLSDKTLYGGTAAIRGGTPICFPQFSGLGPLPKHGIVRTHPWRLAEHGVQGRNAFARFEFTDDEFSRGLWPNPFRVLMTVVLGGSRLSMSLDVFNTGDADFSFTGALHTYFRVGEISQVALAGLGGFDYTEHAGGGEPKPSHQHAMEILFDGNEIDRVYAGAGGPFTIREPDRTLQITSKGFPDCVVWNPGPLLAAKLTDMEPDGYRRMVCVESAIVARPVILRSGQCWSGSQILDVLEV